MRPANLVTAVADIAAGFAVGWMLSRETGIWMGLAEMWGDFLLLCLATIGLYGGGVVFNDVFDVELDRIERPERPLPSGQVSLRQAITLGGGLLAMGIIAACIVGPLSGLLAVGIAGLALYYDKYGKHHAVWGPITMSGCRGGNLLLGISLFPESLIQSYGLAILPLIYISSITLISRGEVTGGNKRHLGLAILGYSGVVAILLGLGILFPYRALFVCPFVLLFVIIAFPPLIRAWRSRDAGDIRKAVKAGVITLILLDAALAAGFSNVGYGLSIAVLLPISLGLAKLFSVT